MGGQSNQSADKTFEIIIKYSLASHSVYEGSEVFRVVSQYGNTDMVMRARTHQDQNTFRFCFLDKNEYRILLRTSKKATITTLGAVTYKNRCFSLPNNTRLISLSMHALKQLHFRPVEFGELFVIPEPVVDLRSRSPKRCLGCPGCNFGRRKQWCDDAIKFYIDNFKAFTNL
jgi:hypothetical protein